MITGGLPVLKSVVIGMARIMTCARGVAKLLSGGTWEDTGLPECFQPTSERMIKDGQWAAMLG